MGSEPLSGCFKVFVNFESGVIAYGKSGKPVTLETDAQNEIARITPQQKEAPVQSVASAPVQSAVAAPEPRAPP